MSDFIWKRLFLGLSYLFLILVAHIVFVGVIPAAVGILWVHYTGLKELTWLIAFVALWPSLVGWGWLIRCWECWRYGEDFHKTWENINREQHYREL